MSLVTFGYWRATAELLDRGVSSPGGEFVQQCPIVVAEGWVQRGKLLSVLGIAGVSAATNRYDFHATILHLPGIDHERLTFRQNGIVRRLNDVHGHVVEEILA